MAMAIINDPTLVDPLSAIIFKRLSDARRLMRKDPRRLNRAIHTYELLERTE